MRSLLRARDVASNPRRPHPARQSQAPPTGCPQISPSRGHDFDRINVHSAFRNAKDSSAEVLTQNPPGAQPAPPAAPAPEPGVSCKVLTGPSYNPSGSVPVAPEDGGKKKRAVFHLAASFANTAANPARCCEVRQYIMWDDAFRDWNKGPPHNRFDQDDPNFFYEDRSAKNGSRYGHRSGRYSRPTPGCKDEYRTGATQDTANGDTYCGEDAPLAPAAATGQFQFYLGVDDVCQGSVGHEVAAGDPLILNW